MDREAVYARRYLAGCVKRYHTWPTITTQTVGQHCWRVAGIVVEIFGLPRAEVLYCALHHDSGELWAGDLPFGTKVAYPELKTGMIEAEACGLRKLGIELPEISDREAVMIKIADLLEMWEFGEHELLLGNKYALPIVNDTSRAACQLALLQEGFSKKVDEWIGEHYA